MPWCGIGSQPPYNLISNAMVLGRHDRTTSIKTVEVSKTYTLSSGNLHAIIAPKAAGFLFEIGLNPLFPLPRRARDCPCRHSPKSRSPDISVGFPVMNHLGRRIIALAHMCYNGYNGLAVSNARPTHRGRLGSLNGMGRCEAPHVFHAYE